MKLKVCGMTYRENIMEVAALRPDFLGFIFYDKSSRYFKSRMPELAKEIKKVGVFVNAPLDEVLGKIKTFDLDLVQLHGDESPDYCYQIKQKNHLDHKKGSLGRKNGTSTMGVEVIKVFSIEDTFDFEAIRPYEDLCDYYLFDTKGKLPGGNGYTFNWNVLKDYPSEKPYFLSGGIGTDTLPKVKEFLKTSYSKYCYAIDVNSKFESEPGLKKIDELERFKHELQRK
jgi:phosphoribosylanthranilate isomerase